MSNTRPPPPRRQARDKHCQLIGTCSRIPSQMVTTTRTCDALLLSNRPGELTRHSEIQSLTPSIFDYVKKYGRTYHGYQAGGKHRRATPSLAFSANAP